MTNGGGRKEGRMGWKDFRWNRGEGERSNLRKKGSDLKGKEGMEWIEIE